MMRQGANRPYLFICISIVLNLLLYEKHNGVEIYKNVQFKSYFKNQYNILKKIISYRNNDNKNLAHKIIRLCITLGSQSKTKGVYA